jgi:sodium/proline symporter
LKIDRDTKIQMLLVLVAYLAFIEGVGLFASRKTKNEKEFVLGRRNMPGWATALSERVTSESAWCLLSLPGLAYATGLSSVWAALGCVSGIFLSWIFIAERFRSEAEKYDAYTLPEYLAKKYAEVGNPIRILTAITITFFFFFYIGSQFAGAGKVLGTLFDISPIICILIGALVILPYTVTGGFRSVVVVDDVQALLMLTTLVVTPVLGLAAILAGKAEFALPIGEVLTGSGGIGESLTGGVSGFAGGLLIFNNMAWFFGYLGGQPQLSARFMATRNKEEMCDILPQLKSWASSDSSKLRRIACSSCFHDPACSQPLKDGCRGEISTGVNSREPHGIF